MGVNDILVCKALHCGDIFYVESLVNGSYQEVLRSGTILVASPQINVRSRKLFFHFSTKTYVVGSGYSKEPSFRAPKIYV